MGNARPNRRRQSSKDHAPFRYQQLPEELRSRWPTGAPFVEYMEWALNKRADVPAEFHATVALSIGLLECTRRGFHAECGMPMILWFALLGDSAVGKSAAINLGIEFLQELWGQQGVFSTDGTGPTPPLVNCEDGSSQGLLARLYLNYDQRTQTTPALLYAHELSKVFVRKREPIWETFNTLIDGIRHDRHTQELQLQRRRGLDAPDHVRNPRTTALFAMTPESVRPYMTDPVLHGGFFPRMHWVMPRTQSRVTATWSWGRPTADDRLYETLETWERWLVELDTAGDRMVYFYEDAKQYFDEQLWAPLFEPVDDTELEAVIHPIRHRAVGRVHVTASLYALFNGLNATDTVDIALDHVERAGRHAHAAVNTAYAVFEDMHKNEPRKFADRLEAFIRKCGPEGANMSKLYRRFSNKTKAEIQPALETLLDLGTVCGTHMHALGDPGAPRVYVHHEHRSESPYFQGDRLRASNGPAQDGGGLN